MHIQVEQAVNDQDRFWVRVDLIGWQENSQKLPQARLDLPDGQSISNTQAKNSNLPGGGLQIEYQFPPLDVQVLQVTLVLENIDGQDFNLPINLRTLGEDDLVAGAGGNDTLQSESKDGIRLVLDHVAQSTDHTVFQVTIQPDSPNLHLAADWTVALNDIEGNSYPLTEITPDLINTEATTKIFQTVPFLGNEQLILRVTSFPNADSLPIFIDLDNSTTAFTFDAGGKTATWADMGHECSPGFIGLSP